MILALNNQQTVSNALSTRNRLRDGEIIRISWNSFIFYSVSNLYSSIRARAEYIEL